MEDINLQIMTREQISWYSASVASAMEADLGFCRGRVGEGDARLIWFCVDGRNVIATNGDPVWEESDPEGFNDLLEAFE